MYLLSLSVRRSVRCPVSGVRCRINWGMIGEGCERKRMWPTCRRCTGILPGDTEENHDEPQDSRWPNLNSNWTLPVYRLETLLPVWSAPVWRNAPSGTCVVVVFTVRCSQFGVHSSVFAVRCLQFGVRSSVFAVRRSQFGVCSYPNWHFCRRYSVSK
jgi:hypothetical protein